MQDNTAETAPLLPELLAPQGLRQKCQEMQAQAPYLGLGYQKSRLAPALHQRLLAHFRSHVERFQAEHAIDEIGSVDTGRIATLVFDDPAFNLQLAEDMRPLHEAWAGMPLVLSNCYGIRCYQRGTFLHNHVDRQPHFISATVCVDHSLNSRWPLHIEGIDGEIRQIDLEPGEFVFYEGTRLVHGRPYPLDGDYYAGIFVHYHPASGALSSDWK